MSGRQRPKLGAAPIYGPDDDDQFSVEVHHGGFFFGSGSGRVYLDGSVDWFDNVKAKFRSFNALEEIAVVLGYDLGVPLHSLLPDLDMGTGLRLIASDTEAQIMKHVAFKVKNYVLYIDHLNTLDGSITPSYQSKVPGRTRKESADVDGSASSEGLEFCPKIRKKLQRHAELANTCYAVPSGSGVFEVHDREWQFNVDIGARHCDCRRWSLTGSPCSHAISCLRHERIPEESMLPWCYSTQAFQQAYGWFIKPCNDKSTWEKVDAQEVKPPVYEKKPGRPAKARRKVVHEVGGPNGPRLTKHGVNMHCTHCGEPGHSTRGCERKKAGEPSVKKSRKEPTRAVPQEQTNEEPNIVQEDNQNEGGTQPLLSTLDNPMVSQLLDEAAQNVRETTVKQPMPNSAYISSNLPAARHMPLTTASRIVRATRVTEEKKKMATRANNKSKK